jgi:3'-phosphoadenosine 5'-phosphosulfate sulfotransferase (PAPS reductase)/FAD synthetase
VSKEDLDRLVDQTAEEIRRVTKGKRAALAWSGGKDSIVLEFVSKLAGIEEGVWVRTKELEYPEQLRYSQATKPPFIEEVVTNHDLPWLSRNPLFLFPELSSPYSDRWSKIVQRNHQDDYVKQNQVEIMLLGRRKKDGNYVPSSKLMSKGDSVRYFPLADWTHEEVFALFKHYNIPLPPIYSWKDGFHIGTIWAERGPNGKPVDEVWQDIYDIDPSIIHAAAPFIPSSASFLQKRGLG